MLMKFEMYGKFLWFKKNNAIFMHVIKNPMSVTVKLVSRVSDVFNAAHIYSLLTIQSKSCPGQVSLQKQKCIFCIK